MKGKVDGDMLAVLGSLQRVSIQMLKRNVWLIYY